MRKKLLEYLAFILIGLALSFAVMKYESSAHEGYWYGDDFSGGLNPYYQPPIPATSFWQHWMWGVVITSSCLIGGLALFIVKDKN